jgi:hypothetical protein
MMYEDAVPNKTNFAVTATVDDHDLAIDGGCFSRNLVAGHLYACSAPLSGCR